MVDRGLGHPNQASHSLVGKNIVVVFIGGRDDREALTLASHMSQHPAIRLTVVRFLPDASTQARQSVRSIASHKFNPSFTSYEELQMQMDDEFFADFYKRYVTHYEARHWTCCESTDKCKADWYFIYILYQFNLIFVVNLGIL